MNFLQPIASHLPPRADPLVLPWPEPGRPGAFRTFATVAEWETFIAELGLDRAIPEIVRAKFQRAQKAYLAGWLDADLIKAGELIAFTALELALIDRYAQVVPARRRRKPKPHSRMLPTPSLAELLNHLVVVEGLTDSQLPFVQRYGGAVVERLRADSKVHPTLPELRNELSHGFPFDSLPTAGLLELLRDLIHFAYQSWLLEHQGLDPADSRVA